MQRNDSNMKSESPSDDDLEMNRIWLKTTFERLEQPLLAYCLRLLRGNIDLASDCVQDAFLSLCRESRSDVEGHVDAWLFRTCRNRAMDFHRREARMTFDSETVSTAASTSSGPASLLIEQDEQAQLRQEINRLPLRDQEVLALRLSQGLSYKQIAEITDLSVSNVGVILHQAIMKLKASISP